MNIVLIALYIACAILNGICAGIKFSMNNNGSGWMYVVIAALWLVCVLLKIISL